MIAGDEEEDISLFERIRESIASYGIWRIGLFLSCLAMLFGSGISYFNTPSHEVIYSHHGLVVPADSTILVLYIMEFGNTGRHTIDNIDIKLRQDLVKRAALPPNFANHGIGERKVDSRIDGNAAVYSMGEVEPGKRIKCTVSVTYNNRGEAVPWEDLLIAVEPTQGDVKYGDPASTAFMRIIYGFLSLF